ncbi:MAG: oxygen-independent coproporphyrinogen III oxidase [Candidatus Sumerlaeia bacterium]
MALINDTLRLRDLDPSFLSRYNLIGPRYTSYPTAPQWTEAVGAAELRRHLETQRERGAGRPLSIYVHIPFCIERCSFCACNVIATPKRRAVSEPYLDLVEREAGLWSRSLSRERPVVQLHWGGGTPTYLSPPQLERLHAILAERFNIAADAERSVEIHVSWTSDEQLETLARLGFNRISLGVQDFSERTMAAIGRRQSLERTREAIQACRALGFGGINFDLIYGLPHQTAESFGETVERVIEMRPDRLALYNFAYLPAKMPNQRAIDPKTLPAGAEKFRIFLEAHDRFVNAGYRYIGLDHFALPGDELARAFDGGTMQRNFMGFTTRAGADLVGMGASGISSIAGLDTQNHKKLKAYERALNANEFPAERGLMLSKDDLIRRDVIGAIMCRDVFDKGEIERKHGIRFDAYFAEELARLAPLAADELLSMGGDAIRLTFLGRLFARNIAMVFDAYLKKPDAKNVTYSRTL